MDIDWKALFLSPAGRIKRQTYWIGWGAQFVAGIVLSVICQPISPYLGSVVGLALLYPMYCIYAKRLQDMGKPGALAAIPVGLGLASLALSLYMVAVLGIKSRFSMTPTPEMADHMGTLMAISGASLLIGLGSLVFWLVLGIANGQEGPNAYGVEPGSEDESAFD
jgi:uncharacterized membrane protein YhaH (DUF805 family)